MNSTEDFQQSLGQNQPPEELGDLLKALWWEAKGDWDKAHKIAQDIHNSDAAWVHAYLHRKEGDEGNAGYWYSRAGKPHATQSHDEELESLIQTFLKKHVNG